MFVSSEEKGKSDFLGLSILEDSHRRDIAQVDSVGICVLQVSTGIVHVDLELRFVLYQGVVLEKRFEADVVYAYFRELFLAGS